MNTLNVINTEGSRFSVVVIPKGGRYGWNDCLTNDKEPLIEFYTLGKDNATTKKIRSIHGPLGRFVSRYNLSTLVDPVWYTPGNGLCLDGGNLDLWVDGHIVGMAVNLAEKTVN